MQITNSSERLYQRPVDELRNAGQRLSPARGDVRAFEKKFCYRLAGLFYFKRCLGARDIFYRESVMSVKNLGLGEVGTITFKNYINLISDTSNLSQDSKITLPSGLEVLSANIVVTKQKYTTKQYIKKTTQPGLVSVDKEAFVTLKESIDEAKAKADFLGKKVFGFGSLKSSLDSISLRQVINATTHAEVHVYAWADGKKYSSRDGVIVADVVIEVIKRPTGDDIADLIVAVVKHLDGNTQESLDAAFKQVEKFGEAAKAAA